MSPARHAARPRAPAGPPPSPHELAARGFPTSGARRAGWLPVALGAGTVRRGGMAQPSQGALRRAKVGTQWFAVDADDKPTGAPVDIELAYETYGRPGDAPLLLCNGIAMQGIMFGTEFLQALAAAGPYYVIVYDARDCGLSTQIDTAGDPPIVQVFAQKQLGLRQQRKDGIPYFMSCVSSVHPALKIGS